MLILGDGHALGEAVVARLRRDGFEGRSLVGGTDSAISSELADGTWRAVVVVTHEDALALRLTLLCSHVRPELPLWVSLFDRTIMHRLREIAPSVRVVQTAEMVAGELADRCAEALAGSDTGPRVGMRIVDDALRLMLWTGLALLAALVAQVAMSMVDLHYGLVDALYYSTRSVATVADLPRTAHAAAWFKLGSTLVTVVSVVLVAVFTAALVRRLSRPRLTTLFGQRRAPVSGHVIVIGFGQVGFRLAQELRRRRIPVGAVERNIDAPCVRLARRAGIPVAIGRGDDRELLELMGVRRCGAVAAVTSDDLVNVEVGLAASDLRSGVPLILRLGDGDVVAETDSMLHLGQICDVHDLVASRVAADVVATLSTGPQA